MYDRRPSTKEIPGQAGDAWLVDLRAAVLEPPHSDLLDLPIDTSFFLGGIVKAPTLVDPLAGPIAVDVVELLEVDGVHHADCDVFLRIGGPVPVLDDGDVVLLDGVRKRPDDPYKKSDTLTTGN
jgi:hypothetical protein